MDRGSEWPLDEAGRDIDELHQLLLTGLRPDTGLAQAFRDRLRDVAARGDGHGAVKAAFEEADELAAPAFAAPRDASRVEALEVAMLALAVELANANANADAEANASTHAERSDVTQPPT